MFLIVVVCGQLGLGDGTIELTDGNREGSVATHTCNGGFLLNGDQERTCLSSGVWSGSAVLCSLRKSDCHTHCYSIYNQSIILLLYSHADLI